MAEYHPLISRAIANLGESTPEQRKALYARATNALLSQLRSSDPPIEEDDIAREQSALEDAIRRVETEVGGGVERDLLVHDGTGPLAAPAPPEPQTSLRAWQDRQPPDVPNAGRPARDELPDEDITDRGYAPEIAPVVPDTQRPLAPRVETQDRRWLRATIVGGAIAVVVVMTAAAALMLKHQPADFAPQSASSAAANAETERKSQERLAGETPPAPPAQAASPAVPAAPSQRAEAPAASPAPSQAQAPVQAAPAAPAPAPATPGATIPGAQRALLVEQPPDGAQDVKPVIGRVVWRLENVPGGPGEPLDAGVRAEVDIAEAGLKVSVLLRRNRDAALPVSHTVEMTFASAGEPNGAIRDVAVPEMRQEEAVRGTPLSGIAVPVRENLFLIGLSNLPQDVQRNVELIRNRNWWMVAFRYSNGRRAILVFEKGLTGTRTVADGLQAWQ